MGMLSLSIRTLSNSILLLLMTSILFIPSAESSYKLQINFFNGSYVDCDPNSIDRSFTGSFEDCINPKINTDLQDNGCDSPKLYVKVLGANNETVGLGYIKYKTFKYTGVDEGAVEWLGDSRVWYGIDCIYSGSIKLKNSNFYRFFIDGDFTQELRKENLIKKKWKLSINS